MFKNAYFSKHYPFLCSNPQVVRIINVYAISVNFRREIVLTILAKISFQRQWFSHFRENWKMHFRVNTSRSNASYSSSLTLMHARRVSPQLMPVSTFYSVLLIMTADAAVLYASLNKADAINFIRRANCAGEMLQFRYNGFTSRAPSF
jgi:hypothetical protein